MTAAWPTDADALIDAQRALGEQRPEPWRPADAPRVGGAFACFAGDGPGHAGETVWAAAAVGDETATALGETLAPYEPGLLALRAGPALDAAVRALAHAPDVLIVDATGRDHPRRAGLAVQLGHVLGLPTIGVTHRTLLAAGDWPAPERGARSPLMLAGDEVGAWLRVMPRARPIAVHAGWRTDPDTAVAVVLAIARNVRTPEPLRAARRAARLLRAASTLDRA
jgi:deoxyribonuclease V